MDTRVIEIAERIKALREICGFGITEMAAATGVSEEEYGVLESGASDFSFTFLYKCAEKLGVDIVELLTGENPRLSHYTVVRKGTGLNMKRRAGFRYEHLASYFKNKAAEPFKVYAPYSDSDQSKPIGLSTHEGQELDYVLKGSLKVQIGEHAEILNEGDAIYYDSSVGHGMIATDGKDCEFLAVVLKKEAN